MGAFLITSKSSQCFSDDVDSALQVFIEMGLSEPRIIESETHTFYIHKKVLIDNENLYFLDNSNFIFTTGTLFYEDHIGIESLRRIYEDIIIHGLTADLIDKFSGNYCLVITINGITEVLNDRIGIYHTFISQNWDFISSSFLAVALFTGSKSLDLQSIQEFILTGVIYGGGTYINEVKHLDRNLVYNIDTSNSFVKNPIKYENYNGEDLSYFVDKFSTILKRVFGPLKKNFTSNTIYSALTAGYDSRLMLSAMRDLGIEPNLYVYDNGTQDLNISSKISENLNLSLRKYKYLDYPIYTKDSEYIDLLKKSFIMNDGKNDSGIFYQGFDWLMRAEYFNGAQIHMNGFGGELLRNAYGLYDTKLSFDDYFKIRYDRLNFTTIVKWGTKKQYFRELQNKFAKEISLNTEFLSRIDVQRLIALNHYQYWGGTNQSIKGRFTHSFAPLMDVEFVAESFKIPMKFRNFGFLNRKLISNLDNQLARQSSDYGYNFYEGPNLIQKIKEISRVYIPLNARPYIRKFIAKNAKNTNPITLQPQIVSELFEGGKYKMDEYFKRNEIKSPNMLSRFFTVEYFIKNYLEA